MLIGRIIAKNVGGRNHDVYCSISYPEFGDGLRGVHQQQDDSCGTQCTLHIKLNKIRLVTYFIVLTANMYQIYSLKMTL